MNLFVYGALTAGETRKDVIGRDVPGIPATPVSYTHLTLPTTPYV